MKLARKGSGTVVSSEGVNKTNEVNTHDNKEMRGFRIPTVFSGHSFES